MAIYDDRTGITLLDSQVPFVPGLLPPSLEKHYMNPIRFRVNYCIVPGYAAFCAVCLILVLGGIDDQKYMAVMIGLFVLLAAVSVWFLMTVPNTREKELVSELERYSFDASDVEERDVYSIELEGVALELSENGLKVDGRFHWYNHISPRLVTSNRFNRVWIAVRFGGEVDRNALFVPLSPILIRAVEYLNIPLENREMLYYLLEHKRNAFAQIYNSGTFQIISDE